MSTNVPKVPRALDPNNRDNVIHAATEASFQQRRIRDIPQDLSPGARQVALLTSVTKAQASTIKPMAEALTTLKALGPDIWSAEFLVADKMVFDWRTAPWRRYESFEDFYDTELKSIYDDYEEFIHDARRVAEGELSGKTAAARAAIGTIRQIARDHPDIFQRLKDGEYKSVHAAALDAGIVPRTFMVRADRPESIVATLRKQLPSDVLQDVIALFGGPDHRAGAGGVAVPDGYVVAAVADADGDISTNSTTPPPRRHL